MDFMDMLQKAVEENASDVFLIPGLPLSYKLNGVICQKENGRMSVEGIDHLIHQIYEQAERRSIRLLEQEGDDDFSFSIPGLSRFRVNAFKQRSSLAAVIRIVSFSLPDYRELNIPKEVIDISKMQKGFVLVTGPAGSGKSTTQACIIDQINRNRNAHIVTLEDPIEYLHRHNRSIVTQREIGTDSISYEAALRGALRQSPDVILLGEMRDYETIKTAITAAETGHLVISTLHTTGAANTIDRIIDSFPPQQQRQIQIQLSMALEIVVSQQLLPCTDGTEIPAFEIMRLNKAIRTMIRDSKIHQIDSVIQSSGQQGMVAMDGSLTRLYREGKILRQTAIDYSMNSESMEWKLNRESGR